MDDTDPSVCTYCQGQICCGPSERYGWGKYVQYDDDDDIHDNDNDNENFDNVNDNNKKVKHYFPLGHICCLPSEIYRQAKLMITMKIVMMDNPVDSTMNSSDYQHVNMMDF